mmetsp:Transcript_62188/g.148361  ORF Transcript_62188/g.148361 Transcript_62188/m.148361 type:complete len:248 (+) Transcript_62188:65-808(+)
MASAQGGTSSKGMRSSKFVAGVLLSLRRHAHAERLRQWRPSPPPQCSRLKQPGTMEAAQPPSSEGRAEMLPIVPEGPPLPKAVSHSGSSRRTHPRCVASKPAVAEKEPGICSDSGRQGHKDAAKEKQQKPVQRPPKKLSRLPPPAQPPPVLQTQCGGGAGVRFSVSCGSNSPSELRDLHEMDSLDFLQIEDTTEKFRGKESGHYSGRYTSSCRFGAHHRMQCISKEQDNMYLHGVEGILRNSLIRRM